MPTKIVILQGGLGNLIFQYMFFSALRILYPAENIKMGPFKKDIITLHSDFQLPELFNLDKEHFIDESIINEHIDEYTQFNEDGLFYRDQAFAYKPNEKIIYIGYWQSVKYHKLLGDNWRELLTFSPNFLQDLHKDMHNSRYLEQIKTQQSVAVHIRRGDYIMENIHNLLKLNYYDKALKIMANRLERPTFFIFSNDILWCRKNLPKGYNYVFIEGNERNNAWKDLYLMQQCQHFIIANSSFSWWGAQLSEYAYKLVLAPGHWFQHKLLKNPLEFYSIYDIIPTNWELLYMQDWIYPCKNKSQGFIWSIYRNYYWFMQNTKYNFYNQLYALKRFLLRQNNNNSLG